MEPVNLAQYIPIYNIEIAGQAYQLVFIIYGISFFATVFGALLVLMQYNLIKMFGLDDDIRTFVQSWLQWFTTPPLNTDEDAAAEGGDEEGGDEEGGDDAEEETEDF